MSGCEGYRALARFYDCLNSGIDYSGWADFLEECFRRWLPKRPELVLDLACGTGRMTAELARRGYDMIGVDGSAEMLSEAYSRAGGGILFLQQDLRSFELYGTVGAVVCCLDSLNYLLGDGELAACFSLVHNYLDPGGLFLFDMNTPYKFREIYGTSDYILEGELPPVPGDSAPPAAVYCGWQNHFDPKTNLCDFDLSLFAEAENDSYLREDEHQQERCYTMEEIRAALQSARLELLGVFADWRFAPPDAHTERWFFAARAVKPASPDFPNSEQQKGS